MRLVTCLGEGPQTCGIVDMALEKVLTIVGLVT